MRPVGAPWPTCCARLDLGAALVLLAARREAAATLAWAMIGFSMLVYGVGDGLYAAFGLGLDSVSFRVRRCCLCGLLRSSSSRC
jgi:hypothetical protein